MTLYIILQICNRKNIAITADGCQFHICHSLANQIQLNVLMSERTYKYRYWNSSRMVLVVSNVGALLMEATR